MAVHGVSLVEISPDTNARRFGRTAVNRDGRKRGRMAND